MFCWLIMDCILIFPSLNLISLGTFPIQDCVWIQWTCLHLYHWANFLRYNSRLILFAELICYSLSGYVHLGKTTYCANGHAELCQLCHIHYRCYIQSLVLLFSGFLSFPDSVVEPGQVLYARFLLPCQNSSLLC